MPMERNVFTAEQEMWLVALESGGYRQGHSWLKKGDTYCCLGVAVAIGITHHTSLEEDFVLAWTDAKFLQMRGCSGPLHTPTKTGYRLLIQLNDNASWSFLEIAAFIRANPWQVFTNFDAPDANP
jgi:hypothetical protein